MRIDVKFLNGTTFWQNKVLVNAKRASTVLSNPMFLEKIRTWHGFDDTASLPYQVAASFTVRESIQISVGFYRTWWPWSPTIAYEENGQVWLNTRKSVAGDPGNLAHETCHAMGYHHRGNAAAGNENTVPYLIGQWVNDWLA